MKAVLNNCFTKILSSHVRSLIINSSRFQILDTVRIINSSRFQILDTVSVCVRRFSVIVY
jgi:hypothetical protein